MPTALEEGLSALQILNFTFETRPHRVLAGLFLCKDMISILEIYFETTKTLDSLLVTKQFANF